MNKSAQPFPEKKSGPSAPVRPVAIGVLVIGLAPAIAGVLTLTRLTFDAALLIVMLLFGISLIVFTWAAILLKINPNGRMLLVGLGLACFSFFYQPLGPETGQYGTECDPIERCHGPLRGGGFPLQYMIDVPGITYQSRLGIEDEFRIWSLAQDVVFYFVFGQIARRLILYYHSSRVKT